MKQNILKLLTQIPLFESLSDQNLAALAKVVRLQSLAPGQIIFRKGDEGTALYIVNSGTIKIVLPSKLGAEIIVSIFSKGAFFGEMSLLDGEPRAADAVSIDKSQVIVLKRSEFLSFLHSSKEAINSVLTLLSSKLRKTHDLLEDVCFSTIPKRFAKLIIELGKIYGKTENDVITINLALTQKELGDMIGATRESINKEIRSLRSRGIIKTKANKLLISDLERLKRRAI